MNSSPTSHEKIMVVDDIPSVLDLCFRHFKDLGHESLGTTNPLKALDMIRRESPTLLYLDIDMPEMSGLDLLSEMQKLADQVEIYLPEVVIISGNENPEDLQTAFRRGAVDYLKKPFSRIPLEISLHKAISSRELKRENREYKDKLEQKLRDTQELLRKDRAAKKALRHLSQALVSSNRQLQRSMLDIEQANRAIMMANKHKSEFLARMSHELRTPLNSILGFGEILEDQLFGPLNDKQKSYITNILKSGRHLLSLINDILDISKIESGMLNLNYSTVNIPLALEDSVQLVRGMAGKKNINITYTSAMGDTNLEVDPQKFKQILFNLLSNAIKFSPPESKIELGWRKKEDHFLFWVKDRGIGIKKEFKTRIFYKFQQMESSLARGYEGTGLGLALTRKLVERHGGEIWFESEEDQGTTFFFTLPQKAAPRDISNELDEFEEVSENKKPKKEEKTPEEDGDEFQPAIFVRQDEPERDLIIEYLNAMGYTVRSEKEEGEFKLISPSTYHKRENYTDNDVADENNSNAPPLSSEDTSQREKIDPAKTSAPPPPPQESTDKD